MTIPGKAKLSKRTIRGLNTILDMTERLSDMLGPRNIVSVRLTNQLKIVRPLVGNIPHETKMPSSGYALAEEISDRIGTMYEDVLVDLGRIDTFTPIAAIRSKTVSHTIRTTEILMSALDQIDDTVVWFAKTIKRSKQDENVICNGPCLVVHDDKDTCTDPKVQ